MPTAGTVEQLASDAVRTPDPEAALRALAALRHELDALEPVLVSRALQTGASWSDIARPLGVSKQAAHRKFRHLALEPQPSETEPKILVTSESRRCVQFAREECRRLGHPLLGTEHLLLGILRCRHSVAVRALAALGITRQSALDALQPTLAGLGDSHAKESTTISPHARRILEGSLREALKRHDGYIGVEHLLLALLTDRQNGAVQTLEALGTTPAKIRRELSRQWKMDRAEAMRESATT